MLSVSVCAVKKTDNRPLFMGKTGAIFAVNNVESQSSKGRVVRIGKVVGQLS